MKKVTRMPAMAGVPVIAVGCWGNILATGTCATAAGGMEPSVSPAFVNFTLLLAIALVLLLFAALIYHTLFGEKEQAPWPIQVAERLSLFLMLLYLIGVPLGLYIWFGFGGDLSCNLMWLFGSFAQFIAFDGLALIFWKSQHATPHGKLRFCYSAALYVGLSFYVILIALLVLGDLSHFDTSQDQDSRYIRMAQWVLYLQVCMIFYTYFVMFTKATADVLGQLLVGGIAAAFFLFCFSFLVPLPGIYGIRKYVLQPLPVSAPEPTPQPFPTHLADPLNA